MQNLILKFVDSARAAGLRISTSETLDCLNQLQHIDPLEESQFSRTLRANFAKSHRDQRLFNHLVSLAATESAGVQTGVFGADMKVRLLNDGPVTFWLQVPPAA